MDERLFFKWVQEKGLAKWVKRAQPYMRHVLKHNLGARRERLLVISDLGSPERRVPAVLGAAYLLAGRELGLKTSLALQKRVSHAESAGENVIEALLDHGENNIIAMALTGKLGSLKQLGKSFRKLVRQRGFRFVSTPSLGAFSTQGTKYVLQAINVDYKKMEKRGEPIKKAIDNGSMVRVRTRKGTDFCYDVEGMQAINNTGIYREPGTGGNIPAGEVYVACRGTNVEGKIVIDASLKTRQRCLLLKHSVKLHVKKGRVESIEGNGVARELENTFIWAEQFSKRPHNVRNVCELGIGTNPNARVVGPTIINEKSLGTAHIAIGSNHWFGGSIRTNTHFDQVFYDPIISIDGKVLNGSFFSLR